LHNLPALAIGSGGGLVMITGASSGIGKALACRYHAAGYRLALVARRGNEIADWTARAGWDPRRFRIYPADVSDISQAVGAGQSCTAELGLPDIVIANAGISAGMDTAVLDDIGFMRQVLVTNVVGMAATFQPFVAPFVQRRHGTLVGIGSVAGIRGLPGHGAYCASKAAVISYCESLRGEMLQATGRKGVKVVTISPGYVATPLTRRNPFFMPFLMSADEFALRAMKAIARGTSYQVIPWQMGLVAGLLQAMPNGLFDRMMKGRPRKPRRGLEE
jgi:short-subunit dehydrogenase